MGEAQQPRGHLVGPSDPSPSNTRTSTPRAHDVTLRAEDQRPRRGVLHLGDRGLEVVEHHGPEEVERRRVEHQLADVVVLFIEGLRHGADPTMIRSCCARRCATCWGSRSPILCAPFGPWDQVELAAAVSRRAGSARSAPRSARCRSSRPNGGGCASGPTGRSRSTTPSARSTRTPSRRRCASRRPPSRSTSASSAELIARAHAAGSCGSSR